MPYLLKIKNSAFKEIQKIDKPSRQRVIEAIDKLTSNPHIGKQLKGEHSGLRRIRSGSYRVVYEINENEIVVLILRVAHRKDIYQ